MNKRDEEDQHQIDTVPPPPGEEDAYSAETRIGKIPADLLQAMKRAHASETTLSRLPAESSPKSLRSDAAKGGSPISVERPPVSGIKASALRTPAAKNSSILPPPLETAPPALQTDDRVSDFPFPYEEVVLEQDEDYVGTMLMLQKNLAPPPPALDPIALPPVLERGGVPVRAPDSHLAPPVPPDLASSPEVSLMHRVPSPEVLQMIEDARAGEGRMSFQSFASMVDERARRRRLATIAAVAGLVLIVAVWLLSK
ncbi:MAG TPA: hypothetical protein VNO21_15485 [Polyangiaceae bacterium]|nr:hypothetical protein [Polyangiaceae bacterium]